MIGIKKARAVTLFNFRKKNEFEEIKIACAGCRREVETYELHYDPSIEELICKMCRCVYANLEQYQIEMEDK